MVFLSGSLTLSSWVLVCLAALHSDLQSLWRMKKNIVYVFTRLYLHYCIPESCLSDFDRFITMRNNFLYKSSGFDDVVHRIHLNKNLWKAGEQSKFKLCYLLADALRVTFPFQFGLLWKPKVSGCSNFKNIGWTNIFCSFPGNTEHLLTITGKTITITIHTYIHTFIISFIWILLQQWLVSLYSTYK